MDMDLLSLLVIHSFIHLFEKIFIKHTICADSVLDVGYAVRQSIKAPALMGLTLQ